MPDEPIGSRVIITVHATGLTDEQIIALRAAVKALVADHAAAVIQTRVIDQSVTPAAERPPRE